MAKQVRTVDEYLDAFPEKVSKTLEHLRKAIKSAATEAEEEISYRIPIYRYKGDLIAFAAFKNHCSLITMSYSILKDLKTELLPYKTSGTTIQFQVNKPLPAALVKKIVRARMKENEVSYRKKVKQ